MGQQTLDGTDLTALREAYVEAVTERLPARARAVGDWRIQEDHCFARVVLDGVFEGVWYDHVDSRPAYGHLSAEELRAALAVAERLLEEGRPAVVALNERSLRLRAARR